MGDPGAGHSPAARQRCTPGCLLGGMSHHGGQKGFYSPRTHPWAPRTKRGAELSQRDAPNGAESPRSPQMPPGMGRGAGSSPAPGCRGGPHKAPQAGKWGISPPGPIAQSQLLCAWETVRAREKDSGRGEISPRLPAGSAQPSAPRRRGEAAVRRPQSPAGPRATSSPGTGQPDWHQDFA